MAMNGYSKQDVVTYLEPAVNPPKDCYSQCTIDASNVEILYWPVKTSAEKANDVMTTAAVTPYTLVSDGFSYISPSVYVIYRSLCANANIGLIDLSPDPGLAPSGGLAPFGTVYTTTIGYPPEALSTSHCFIDGWVAMNYTDVQHPPPYHECGETSPYFSFPADINTLDPAWSACKINPYGGFDPSRALNKAVGLVSSPVSFATLGSDPGTITTASAAPGSRLGLARASATATSAGGKGTGNVPQIVRRPHKVPFHGFPAQKGTEDGQYNGQKDNIHKVVAHEPDRALSDISNRVHVSGTSSAPSKLLLESQAVRGALGISGNSSDSNTPESASIVVDGNHRSPASLSPGSKQGMDKIGGARNISGMEAFTGSCSGKEIEINKMCMAIAIFMGLRAVTFVL